MKLCNKMGIRPGMSEPRPCSRKIHHTGWHTYDLTGMKNVYRFKEILRRGPNEGKHIRWWVLDRWNYERLISQNNLFSGYTKGLHAAPNSGLGSNNKQNQTKPEYATVRNHWKNIFDSNDSRHRSYKNIKFYDGWNPDKGGSFIAGMDWIIKNIGPKINRHYELHVIKSKKYPYGFFGPGGVVWRNKMDRHDQDLLDLIYDWSKKKRENFIKELKRLQ